MPASFEVFVDADALYRFQLKAANGAVLADSQPYSTIEHARAGMTALQRAAAEAPVPDDDASVDVQSGIHMHFAIRPSADT